MWVGDGLRVHKTADMGLMCECETTTHYVMPTAKEQVDGTIWGYQHESMVVYNAYAKTCGIWRGLCMCYEYAFSHARKNLVNGKTAGR